MRAVVKRPGWIGQKMWHWKTEKKKKGLLLEATGLGRKTEELWNSTDKETSTGESRISSGD